MATRRPSQPAAGSRQRAANVRTAASLAAIALVFFVGIIVAEAVGGPLVAMGVIGSAVFLFLLVAIGRNLRR